MTRGAWGIARDGRVWFDDPQDRAEYDKLMLERRLDAYRVEVDLLAYLAKQPRRTATHAALVAAVESDVDGSPLDMILVALDRLQQRGTIRKVTKRRRHDQTQYVLVPRGAR